MEQLSPSSRLLSEHTKEKKWQFGIDLSLDPMLATDEFLNLPVGCAALSILQYCVHTALAMVQQGNSAVRVGILRAPYLFEELLE